MTILKNLVDKACKSWRFLKKLFTATLTLFFEEDMGAGAKALTYSTLMGVVPLLAILFAIAKGFGLSEIIEEKIRNAFLTQPEAADALMGFVGNYLNNTKGGIFLGFGILLLLWSLLNLADSIEVTFNKIWQLKSDRSISRKLIDYTAIVFLLPIIIFVSMGFTVFLSSSIENIPDILILKPATKIVVEVVSYVLLILVFMLLYIFLPNTKVHFSSALISAIPAAITFILWQTVYVNSQHWLSSYDTIYGSFAAIPLFMLWCLVSWYIVLFGASMTSVYQNDVRLGTFAIEKESRRTFEHLCILAASIICKRFANEQPAPEAKDIARELHQPVRTVNQLAEALQSAGLILPTETSDAKAFVPSADVHLYTVGYIVDRLKGTKEDTPLPWQKEYNDYQEQIKTTGFAATKVIEL